MNINPEYREADQSIEICFMPLIPVDEIEFNLEFDISALEKLFEEKHDGP